MKSDIQITTTTFKNIKIVQTNTSTPGKSSSMRKKVYVDGKAVTGTIRWRAIDEVANAPVEF